MDLETRKASQLTNGLGEVSPQCPRDGRWVMYLSEDNCGAGNLCRISLDGGPSTPLTSHPAIAARLTPDGTHVLFSFIDAKLGEKRRAGILTLDRNPTAPIIYPEPAPSFAAIRDGHWIPGELTLSYVDARSGAPNIWTWSLDGEQQRQITHFSTGRIFSFAWAPDGSKLAISRGAVSSDLVLFSRRDKR
jgi:Tol biopolymer transport system component